MDECWTRTCQVFLNSDQTTWKVVADATATVPSSAAEIRRALVRCLAMTATAVAGIHWR